MKKIKTFLAIGLAMIFCCLLSTGCNNNSNQPDNSNSESENVSSHGISIKFSDEFYIECNQSDILISDTNEIFVKENTSIAPKLKKEFTKPLIDSNTDKIDFSKSIVYHNICVNNETISFEEFKNYEFVATDDIEISLAKSEIKPIGVCVYQKTSKNSNWGSTQKNPENIKNYLTFSNNQISTNDKFLLYTASLDDSTFISNSTQAVEMINNSTSLNITMEIFFETTKILPTIICRDTKNNFHLINLDVVTVNYAENNTQNVLLFNDMQTGNFNKVSSMTLTITNNFSSIKK